MPGVISLRMCEPVIHGKVPNFCNITRRHDPCKQNLECLAANLKRDQALWLQNRAKCFIEHINDRVKALRFVRRCCIAAAELEKYEKAEMAAEQDGKPVERAKGGANKVEDYFLDSEISDFQQNTFHRRNEPNSRNCDRNRAMESDDDYTSIDTLNETESNDLMKELHRYAEDQLEEIKATNTNNNNDNSISAECSNISTKSDSSNSTQMAESEETKDNSTDSKKKSKKEKMKEKKKTKKDKKGFKKV